MDPFETEITHMLRMLVPPFFNGWKDEIWRKAEHLDATDPEYAGLLSRIKAEVAARGWSKASRGSTSPAQCLDSLTATIPPSMP